MLSHGVFSVVCEVLKRCRRTCSKRRLTSQSSAPDSPSRCYQGVCCVVQSCVCCHDCASEHRAVHCSDPLPLHRALARAGKSVLHLDASDYYGGDDASLSLEQFAALFGATPSPHSENSATASESVVGVPLRSALHNVAIRTNEASPLTPAQLRRCLVDLYPRLLFARSRIPRARTPRPSSSTSLAPRPTRA